MAQVIFKYNGIDILIQCKIDEKFKDIYQKFQVKRQADLNKLMFIYEGKILNSELEFNKIANSIDK